MAVRANPTPSESRKVRFVLCSPGQTSERAAGRADGETLRRRVVVFVVACCVHRGCVREEEKEEQKEEENEKNEVEED